MTPNPFLKKLGFSDTDRVVIVHTDDIGMCQASLTAFEHLWEAGTISSGAVMVPCPWFSSVAQMCRQNPQIDMGVHATLNSEWTAYRWGPVSTRDPATGLLDQEGYFHQWQPAVYEQADPGAVAREVEAQLERALSAGIDVTHLDSHMGTVLHPRFIQSYLQAALARGIPPMLPRLEAKGMEGRLSEEEKAVYAPLLASLEAQGIPLLDGMYGMPLDPEGDHLEIAKQLLAEAPVGISHFILHPSVDTPELRAIAPDWQARVANYHAFLSPKLKAFLKNEGIHLIGYRALRDAMKS
ncbi:MAG: polysaccharide deacetylase family protein [Anaerolineales bacterium]|nr:polysaccharide deacetylase family protein [Anaerolineales bacterium]MCX7755637.1 polysaccharide deacetylase family protein [Anaerolineales bacterium]MDW8278940.1 polysaccharide deacetylase family protein [Anaerolineales bacterium]